MFFVLLIVTFLVALAVSFLVVRPFAGPIVGILKRIIATTSVLLSGEVKRGPGLFSGRLSSLSRGFIAGNGPEVFSGRGESRGTFTTSAIKLGQ